ncbi:MAG: hypothetical protein E6R03_14530 [Hyphomicrobiaceae bacterium]|nr:MAG: hypothetical protein E6R03_14530 [Hyphomicrobiaceae bacterium]
MAEKFFKDNDGVGRTIGDKLMRRAQDADDFRTVMYDTPEGQVMLKTKGGNPELSIKRKEVVAEAPVTDCIASPLIEIAFKHGTPSEPVDPLRNPFTLTSGYRTWHKEKDPGIAGSPDTIPEVQYSSDGLLYFVARKPKKMRFLDSQNRTVDIVLARKPSAESDADNAEYDGTNTFYVVAKALATAAGAVSRFIFSEGRYRYREWYAPRSVNIDWCFPTNSAAVKFLMRRLRKLKLLVWDSTKPAGQEKEIEWHFTEPDIPEMSGSKPDTGCANNSGREISFTGRQFFTEKGHLKEARFRLGFEKPDGGTTDFRLEFKRPGSFLSNFDPELVVNRVGNHPGVNDSPDAAEVVAFGNPYHGLMWWNGTSTTFYKDSTKATQWGFTPLFAVSEVVINPSGVLLQEHQHYNVFKVENTLAPENVVSLEGSDEKYLKDAFFHCGNWDSARYSEVTVRQLRSLHRAFDYWGYSQDNSYFETLYRDDAGTVWVIQISFRVSQGMTISGTRASFGLHVQAFLIQRFGNFMADAVITPAKLLLDVVVPISFEREFRFRTEDTEISSSLGYLYELSYINGVRYAVMGGAMAPKVDYANATDAKGAVIYNRHFAVYFTFSGIGSVSENTLGDGVVVSTTWEANETAGMYSYTEQKRSGSSGTTLVRNDAALASIDCGGSTNFYYPAFSTSFLPQPYEEIYKRTCVTTTLLNIYSENGAWKKTWARHECAAEYPVAQDIVEVTPFSFSQSVVCGVPSGLVATKTQTPGRYRTNWYELSFTDSYRVTNSDGDVLMTAIAHNTREFGAEYEYKIPAAVMADSAPINPGSYLNIGNFELTQLVNRANYTNTLTTSTGVNYSSSGTLGGLWQKCRVWRTKELPVSPGLMTSINGYPTDRGFSPKAHYPQLSTDGSEGTPSCNVPVVYRDSVISITGAQSAPISIPSSYLPYTHAQAGAGWAYDYRTGEFITVPFGEKAYFV